MDDAPKLIHSGSHIGFYSDWLFETASFFHSSRKAASNQQNQQQIAPPFRPFRPNWPQLVPTFCAAPPAGPGIEEGAGALRGWDTGRLRPEVCTVCTVQFQGHLTDLRLIHAMSFFHVISTAEVLPHGLKVLCLEKKRNHGPWT